jgi:hypothetical protein
METIKMKKKGDKMEKCLERKKQKWRNAIRKYESLEFGIY